MATREILIKPKSTVSPLGSKSSSGSSTTQHADQPSQWPLWPISCLPHLPHSPLSAPFPPLWPLWCSFPLVTGISYLPIPSVQACLWHVFTSRRLHLFFPPGVYCSHRQTSADTVPLQLQAFTQMPHTQGTLPHPVLLNGFSQPSLVPCLIFFPSKFIDK